MKITTALRSAIAQDLIAAMANGSTNPNPVMEIYTGTIPAMGGTISDTLLATLTLTTQVATESNGVITFDAITEDGSADASGDAGWCRVLDRDGGEAAYFTIADDGSGEINFNSVSIVAGAPVAVSSLTVTVGGA
ncbi:hypothetical protein [Marinobacter nauticus]|uniref:hypothetical protein n=1 Tax=Marinobacter nauticus TaxID=2743 RepID=UPI001C99CC0F|nr:hypothetical protein [Marinobacter nauticus]MBY5961883.1 hypothetical protein [Marinobacter nauticus]